ncbi:MAG: RsmB/NOP family class I SAM-dependent RNA methyltransferase [Spirochaetales bacterium]|nr:RsmB/NOP family class I SAM-dependent RNA methyltransferase [Spirochaetales bacterium]
MLPITDIYKKMPKEALTIIEQTFDPAVFDKILQAFRAKRRTTFRINTLLGTKKEVVDTLRQSGFKFRELQYLPNAYILDDEADNKLLKTDLAAAGKIYLQSTSSMIPPVVLSPQKDELILDMAAAPGSKTSQIAAIMGNTGKIIAAEEDKLRIQRLDHNLHLLGVNNAETVCGDSTKLTLDALGGRLFDRILIDAPCSGEGRFNLYDRQSYGLWRANMSRTLSNLQKKMLLHGISLLRSGGTAVYSTCTLNIRENEEVVQHLLDNCAEVKIVPIGAELPEMKNTMPGFTSFGETKFDKSLKNCLRVIPSQEAEGFFVCRIVKK